jgi:hypothetical protein
VTDFSAETVQDHSDTVGDAIKNVSRREGGVSGVLSPCTLHNGSPYVSPVSFLHPSGCRVVFRNQM